MGRERETPGRRAGRRRWLAIGLATMLMFLCYTLILFGLAMVSEDESVFGGGVIGIALGLVPGVFFTAAAVSGVPRVGVTSLAATGLWLVIATPVALIDVSAGLVAGFGVGGIIALRRPPEVTVLQRIAAVTACVVYTLAANFVVPAAGIMVGAVLPLAAIGLVDGWQTAESGPESPSSLGV